MKNLILTLAFGLVSLVTFSQDVSINDVTLYPGSDTTLTLKNKDSVVLKDLWTNAYDVKQTLSDFTSVVAFLNWTNDSIFINENDSTIYLQIRISLSEFRNVTIVFDAYASVSENTLDVTDLMVYPNPATTDVKITFESNVSDVPVVIVNTAGQIVYSNTENKVFGTNTLDVNVSDWQKGMYFAKSGKQTFKFVVM